MALMELIRERRSVRAYSSQAVERDKLEALAEAVRLAPSASNSQPWHLILVDDPELKDSVARATFSKVLNFNRFAVGAPAFAVLVLEEPPLLTKTGSILKRRDFPLIDIGIAAAQLCLRATELGLGTCMLGWFDERRIQRLLGIPRRKRLALVVTIGYPANDTPVREKNRKTLDSMRTYNGY